MTPLEAVMTALEARNCAVRGDKAQCPSHDDATPSLSIHAKPDGRVLLHCFADCPVENVVAALGLEMADLFPFPVSRTQGTGEPTATAIPLSRHSSRSGGRSGEFSAKTGDRERADLYIARRVRDVESGRAAVDFDVPLDAEGFAKQASTIRALITRIEIVMALALTHADPGPTPLPVGLVTLLMGGDPENGNQRTDAWRARNALVERRVIRHVLRLPSKHERWEGADCYQPYGFDLASLLFGSGASGINPERVGEVGLDLVGLDPPVKVREEPSVNRTERGEQLSSPIGMVAPGDRTGDASVRYHESHSTPRCGGPQGRDQRSERDP